MGTNLYRLLSSLHKLPYPAPTRNPEFFTDVKSYNEALLRNLESSTGTNNELLLGASKRFLKVPGFSSSSTTSATSASGSLANRKSEDDDVEFLDIPNDLIPGFFSSSTTLATSASGSLANMW